MKRKIYFIISAILQMFASANLIANSNEVFEKTLTTIKDMYSAFPIEFQNRVMNMLNNSGIFFVIGPALVCIIVNAIILILAFAGKVVRKRGLFIFLSVICIVFSSSTVAMILAIVNFIILLSIKKEERERVIKERIKIPDTKENNYSKRDYISAAIIFLFYFSQFIWSSYLPQDNKIISLVIAACFYVFLMVLVFVLFGKKIASDFKRFVKYFNSYIEYDMPKYGFMLISFILVNFICIIITKNATSANQEAVEALPKLVLFVLSVIWAPIVEEIVFRGTIRRFVNNNFVFIVLSSFVFGFMHATGEKSLFDIVITTIPYATLGGWLAYIYAKTDNIINNMVVHSIWNLFAAIMSILLSTII